LFFQNNDQKLECLLYSTQYDGRQKQVLWLIGHDGGFGDSGLISCDRFTNSSSLAVFTPNERSAARVAYVAHTPEKAGHAGKKRLDGHKVSLEESLKLSGNWRVRGA
jgi:hypothetical protein